MRTFARRAGRLLTGLGILALSPIPGLAALAGMAMLGAGPDVFAVTGLVVFASMFFLGLLLCVPRPRPVWGRWLRALVILSVEAAVVWQVAAATLHTPPGGPAPLEPEAGAGCAWDEPLASSMAPNGSRGRSRWCSCTAAPGLADLAGDSAFLAGLTADGYTVYAYDQLLGRSARLATREGTACPATWPI